MGEKISCGDVSELDLIVPCLQRGTEQRRFPGLALCTVVVYRGAVNEMLDMPTKNRRAAKAQSDVMPRASVSFPPEVYKSLEELATKKKVSIAWVVREAVEKYIVDQFPLFGTSFLKEGQ